MNEWIDENVLLPMFMFIFILNVHRILLFITFVVEGGVKTNGKVQNKSKKSILSSGIPINFQYSLAQPQGTPWEPWESHRDTRVSSRPRSLWDFFQRDPTGTPVGWGRSVVALGPRSRRDLFRIFFGFVSGCFSGFFKCFRIYCFLLMRFYVFLSRKHTSYKKWVFDQQIANNYKSVDFRSRKIDSG